MDLLSIVQTVWRHKLAAIPVILLTVIAAFYVAEVKPPAYDASSSVLLLSPPGAPTAAQIAAHPKLAKVNANNPYVDFGDLSVVADAVLNVVTSDSAAQALVQSGADPRYQVTLSSAFGNPPIIQVTGVGATPEKAIQSANLVTSAAMTDLYQMQKREGVNPLYMITSVELVKPHQAQKSVSGKLRTLITVIGIGAILLCVVISLIDAIEKRRNGGSADVGKPRAKARKDRPGAAPLPEYGSRQERQRYSEPRLGESVGPPVTASTDSDPFDFSPMRPPEKSRSRNP